MEYETEHVPADPPLVQKAAPTILAALIVGSIGSGIVTWHVSDSNLIRIEKLESFAHKRSRCTLRDCERIENTLAIVRHELDSHAAKEAHREAAERFRVIDRQLTECAEHVRNNRNGHPDL